MTYNKIVRFQDVKDISDKNGWVVGWSNFKCPSFKQGKIMTMFFLLHIFKSLQLACTTHQTAGPVKRV